MAAVQMNVRMDALLKSSGDAVASRCGWTPTQLVRALWEYLMVHGAPPAALRQSLEQGKFDEAYASSQACAQPLEGHELVDSFYERFGYPAPKAERIDYEALKEAAAREQYEDWGLQ